MDDENELEVANDEQRLPSLPVPTRNWVQQLAFEVALGYFTPQELQLKFNLDPESFQRITELADFQRAEADYRREIDDEGIAFRLRARTAAEDMLSQMYAMAYDQTVSAETRRKAMNDVCRYAGYESKAQEGDTGVKLQIYTNLNLNTGGDKTYTIEVPQDQVQ